VNKRDKEIVKARDHQQEYDAVRRDGAKSGMAGRSSAVRKHGWGWNVGALRPLENEALSPAPSHTDRSIRCRKKHASPTQMPTTNPERSRPSTISDSAIDIPASGALIPSLRFI
jgi:hypothetical protein